MKLKVLLVSVFFVYNSFPGISLSHDKVVVIPLVKEVPCKCSGTLSPQGRWCDQGNGTVLEMTNCLVWLKNASWGGTKPYRAALSHDDAHARATMLSPLTCASLNDGSVQGDWRLPTRMELYNLANGSEAIRASNMRIFTGVESGVYWASTVSSFDNGRAWQVDMRDGSMRYYDKTYGYYVWPVRSNRNICLFCPSP